MTNLDYSSLSCLATSEGTNVRLVASTTDKMILIDNNTPVCFAGGKSAKLSIMNTDTEVNAAAHLGKLSLKVSLWPELAWAM